MKNNCNDLKFSTFSRYLISNNFIEYLSIPFQLQKLRSTLWYIVTCYSDYRRGFGLDIGFINHSQLADTNNYNISLSPRFTKYR
jgi:hypothetical protein